MAKDTPPTKKKAHCDLTVFTQIKAGLKPSLLWTTKRLTKRQVDNALTKLKREGLIRKPGYATWEVTVQEMPKRRHTKSHRVGHTYTPIEGTRKPDTIRAHGIVMTMRIPHLVGWSNRAQMLKRLGIEYRTIPQGQSISHEEMKKVWLCDRSIVFYIPGSFYAKIATDAAWYCMEWILQRAKLLEKRLGVSSFKIDKRYKIRFSRHHYALIRNELAKAYNAEKRKLFVYDEDGLWLLIDYSPVDGGGRLEELETIHPKSAIPDNRIVVKAFNDMKKGFTPRFMIDQISKVTANQEVFGKNLISHVESVKLLGEMTGTLATNVKSSIGSLSESVTDLKDTVRDLVHRATETLRKPLTVTEPPNLINIDIIKETGEFYGLLLGKSHLFDLKQGAKIYLDETAALTLIKNGYARKKD